MVVWLRAYTNNNNNNVYFTSRSYIKIILSQDEHNCIKFKQQRYLQDYDFQSMDTQFKPLKEQFTFI